MLLVILCACILGIPIIIGIMIGSIPLVLFGILFFSAFATAIANYGIERQIKMTEIEALRKYNKQGNIQYDFKRKYFTF